MLQSTLCSLSDVDALSERRKNEILNAEDAIPTAERTYYVSADGDDGNDGISPDSAWRTLKKVSEAELLPGDAVRFKRGDLFRGYVKTKPGVTYCAYGDGEKPKIYGWEKDLASPELWQKIDSDLNIWKYVDKITDCGTLVFDGGRMHSRKLIPSYRNGIFVCRDDESVPFDVNIHMDRDLDIFCRYDGKLTDTPSKGEDFPVPLIDEDCYGDLYLRCDAGNPGEVFESIEAIPWSAAFYVYRNENVTIDNICIKYSKFGVSAAGRSVKGLKITNCEIGWIGGNIQHYLGTDPNYPKGKRGTVTRYGNGVEIYGGCDGYEVSNCYIYQSYDAGITHQINTGGRKYELKNVIYRNNLIESCVYSIEYFLDDNLGDSGSIIDGCRIESNIMRLSGYGWGQQRHNVDTPAHIKGWSYKNNAKDFIIADNVLDRSAYRMIHLVAEYPKSCPEMIGNTYVQNKGFWFGQYGANNEKEPKIIIFDENVDKRILQELHETEAKIIFP